MKTINVQFTTVNLFGECGVQINFYGDYMLTCQIRAHQQNLTAIKGKTPIRLGRVPNQNSTDICENYPYNQTMRPEYYMSNLEFTITESTIEIENTSVYIEF